MRHADFDVVHAFGGLARLARYQANLIHIANFDAVKTHRRARAQAGDFGRYVLMRYLGPKKPAPVT